MLKRHLDAALCLLLFVATVTYLYYWPRDLYASDEGLFLYEAKRILSGEVMYRDFFEMVAPLSFYWMALLFGVFGVTIETARVGMAAVHGLIAVLMYLVCREMKVRPGIAVVAAALQVAVFYPALRFASPHWISTFLTLLFLYLLLRAKATGVARAALLGALAAVVIWTQQQKGLAIAGAVGVVIVLDHLLDRQANATWRRSLAVTLAAYVGGLSAVSLPIVVALLVWAGFQPVYAALVLFPLNNYHSYHKNVTWGGTFFNPATYWTPWALWVALVPLLMKFLPLVVIPIAAVRTAWQWAVGRKPDEYRPLLVTTVVAAFTVVSVLYYPDLTHLAIVGPIWSLLVAEAFDTILRRSERRVTAARVVRYALVAGLLLGLGRRAYRNMVRQHKSYPVSYGTAFGQVHFKSPDEFLLVRQLARLSAETSTHEIFAYPCAASLYLLTDTSNPTRFQLLMGNLHSPDHYEEVLTILEQRKVPFIARNLCFVTRKEDPLFPYLQLNYIPLKLPYKNKTIPAFIIYQRRDDGQREAAGEGKP